MSWAKLDDRLYDDPRRDVAGLEAMGLWVAALSYMAAYLTDGAISRERVKKLAGRKGPALAARLVTARLWEEVGDGFALVGWERYLLPRTEVEARSARAAEVGRKGGRSRAERTANEGVKSDLSPTYLGDTPPDNPGDKSALRECNSPEVLETGQATRAHIPVPVPVPDQIPNRESARERPQEHRPAQMGIPFGPSADANPPEAPKAAETPAQKPKRPPPSSQAAPTDEERRIFEAFLKGRKWRRVTKGATPVLDPKRLKIIRTRLAEGHEPADLAAAAQGIWTSDWHHEQAQCRIDLALRDAEHIERFAAAHHAKLDEQAQREREERDEQPFPVAHVPLTPEERADLADELAFCKQFGANLPQEAAHA